MPTSDPTLSVMRARRLRQDMTEAERHLWYTLRRRNPGGWRFRRQAPIGHCIVDFVCHAAKRVIELDGGQPAEDRRACDERRTAWLQSQGFGVLRFWNTDVFQSHEHIYETIVAALAAGPLPDPPPQGYWIPTSSRQGLSPPTIVGGGGLPARDFIPRKEG